jgi:uncharacterized membrane-anchored protein
MIWDREKVLETGVEYKFKTAPIDPTDPFRGKYIILSYEDAIVQVENEVDWKMGEKVFVHLITDHDGFAKIKSVSKEPPTENQDFLKAKVGFITENGTNKLTVEYPFDRYYLEESKANDAELIYRQSLPDTSKITYALVSIKNGEAVLKDVLIDGIAIRDIVKAR